MDTSNREGGGLRSVCSSAGTLLVCQTALDERWKALENGLTDISRRALGSAMEITQISLPVQWAVLGSNQ
jgi:hypothetical protein